MLSDCQKNLLSSLIVENLETVDKMNVGHSLTSVIISNKVCPVSSKFKI